MNFLVALFLVSCQKETISSNIEPFLGNYIGDYKCVGTSNDSGLVSFLISKSSTDVTNVVDIQFDAATKDLWTAFAQKDTLLVSSQRVKAALPLPTGFVYGIGNGKGFFRGDTLYLKVERFGFDSGPKSVCMYRVKKQ